MKRCVWFLFFSLLPAVVPVLAQDHAEVGALADYTRLTWTNPGENFLGLGGRAAFNLNSDIQIEGEMAYGGLRGAMDSFRLPARKWGFRAILLHLRRGKESREIVSTESNRNGRRGLAGVYCLRRRFAGAFGKRNGSRDRCTLAVGRDFEFAPELFEALSHTAKANADRALPMAGGGIKNRGGESLAFIPDFQRNPGVESGKHYVRDRTSGVPMDVGQGFLQNPEKRKFSITGQPREVGGSIEFDLNSATICESFEIPGDRGA